MPSVSPQFSVTVRVELDARQEPLPELTAKIAESGGQLQGVDLVPGAGVEGKRVRVARAEGPLKLRVRVGFTPEPGGKATFAMRSLKAPKRG